MDVEPVDLSQENFSPRYSFIPSYCTYGEERTRAIPSIPNRTNLYQKIDFTK